MRILLFIFFSVYIVLPNFGDINPEIFHKHGLVKLDKRYRTIQKIPIKKSSKKFFKKKSEDTGSVLKSEDKYFPLEGWINRKDAYLEAPFTRKVATENCRVLRN